MVADVAVWAVPFGIIGGRIYHVITSPQAYFGEGGDPVEALMIWKGGLGIWGAVALGGVGAWIGAAATGDPAAPVRRCDRPGTRRGAGGGPVGQLVQPGAVRDARRTLPWAVEIDLDHRPAEYLDVSTFHPTFLYESLWMLAVAGVLVLVDRRWRLGHGRVFALYVALYTVGGSRSS